MTIQYHDRSMLKYLARIIIFNILFNFEMVRTAEPLFNTNAQYTKEKLAFGPMEKRKGSLGIFE